MERDGSGLVIAMPLFSGCWPGLREERARTPRQRTALSIPPQRRCPAMRLLAIMYDLTQHGYVLFGNYTQRTLEHDVLSGFGTQLTQAKGPVEKAGVWIGLRISKPETVKCLAPAAVTAWPVFSLGRYARNEPESPAAKVPTEDEREVVGIVVWGERLLSQPSAGGHARRTSRDGSCCWRASRAGSPRFGAPCWATRSCGGLVCSCRRLLRVTETARAGEPSPNLRLGQTCPSAWSCPMLSTS